MRNSAFRTVTTNSRGVKSSLTRITLCSRGRSTLVLTLVLGLVTVSAMTQGYRVRGGLETHVFSMASLQASPMKTSVEWRGYARSETSCPRICTGAGNFGAGGYERARHHCGAGDQQYPGDDLSSSWTASPFVG